VLCLNKVDGLDEDRRRELSFRHPDVVQVSALTGEGLEELGAALEQRFEETLRPVELLLPYSEGGRLSELHDLAGTALEREDTAEGVRVRARLPVGAIARFRDFAVSGGENRGVEADDTELPVGSEPLDAPGPIADEQPRAAGAGGR
jgi:GTP-binding protein HflX